MAKRLSKRRKKRSPVRFWSAVEDQYLIDNWQTKSKAEMGLALGRTPESVGLHGTTVLGLRKSPEEHRALLARLEGYWYTEAEEQYLRDNWPHKTLPEIAQHLNRSLGSINVKASNMGLKKQAGYWQKVSPAVNLSDNFVAFILAQKNPELRSELLKYPELIEVKRRQIQLNRLINHD